MGVSKNNDTPKASTFRGFSIINHPFWGTPIFGNTHIREFKQVRVQDEFPPLIAYLCNEMGLKRQVLALQVDLKYELNQLAEAAEPPIS